MLTQAGSKSIRQSRFQEIFKSEKVIEEGTREIARETSQLSPPFQEFLQIKFSLLNKAAKLTT